MIPPLPPGDAWSRALLDWFARHRRPMPWRDDPAPYKVWVSEIMLQQTQVATVIPYFNRFLARCPDVRALAAAPPAAILKLWEGLGYYSRARNLQRAAQLIVETRAGQLPACYAEWLTLPGVGTYTAAAIASIAGGESVPAVDGNVLRVFARCLGFRDDIASPAVRRQLFERLQGALTGDLPAGDFNQAVMELGALVCRPRAPACAACPLASVCVAHREGRTAELPVRTRARPGPRYQVAAVRLTAGGAVLLVQRPVDGLLGDLWELPRARRAGREALAVTAVRAASEAIGDAAPQAGALRKVGRFTHAFSHFSETVNLFAAALPETFPTAAPSAAWIPDGTIETLPLTTAARKALRLQAADKRIEDGLRPVTQKSEDGSQRSVGAPGCPDDAGLHVDPMQRIGTGP